jgi:hypothetical protein
VWRSGALPTPPIHAAARLSAPRQRQLLKPGTTEREEPRDHFRFRWARNTPHIAALKRYDVRRSVRRYNFAPAVAFVLSGSTKGLGDWSSFMRHVVLSYAASPAHSAIFALLKPTAYNGS